VPRGEGYYEIDEELLLSYMCLQGKWTFLLVNSVVLVYQHQEYIQQVTPIKVKTILKVWFRNRLSLLTPFPLILQVAAVCGERSESWTLSNWQDYFRNHRVRLFRTMMMKSIHLLSYLVLLGVCYHSSDLSRSATAWVYASMYRYVFYISIWSHQREYR